METAPRPSRDKSPRDKSHLAAIARRLIALRKAFGARQKIPDYTASAFARKLGLAPPTYARYERGEVEMTSLVLMSIRQLTGVSLCNLIAGLDAGSDRIIPWNGTAAGEYQLGDRLRMVRETLEPAMETAAAVMNVDPGIWADWENGSERPPFAKMEQFSHQFGDKHHLGLDFLYRGIVSGVAVELIAVMMRNNPDWAEAAMRATLNGHHNGTPDPRNTAPRERRPRKKA